MTKSISGFGLKVNLVASFTFPAGITLTQFADDADSIDIPSRQIGDGSMGTNGDLVKWKRATKIPLTLNIIPGSSDDTNLDILAQANEPGINKTPIDDNIDITVTYPDGTKGQYLNGFISDVMSGKSMASTGRLKTRAYVFQFESYIGF